jgi:tRNA(Ile)-lysidine synthase
MLNDLLAMIRRYDMLQPGDRVICALSGGADSVALLFGLYLLKEKLQIRLEAAHFNHQLRREESDRGEAFDRELCDRYDIPIHMGTAKIVAGKKGLEAAAREARYAFFDTLPGKIATAHTADDNAETVLMRLVRGTGLKGLGGIHPVRGRIIRPMLLVTRRQVEAFLREYCLSYVEDSSNATDDFLRNRIRRHIIPALREENPQFGRNLSAMALRLRLDEAALTPDTDYSAGVSVPETLALPEAVRSRCLEGFLEHCGVREPESAHIVQAEALLHSDNPSARANFPGNIVIAREYDRLTALNREPNPEGGPLRCPGITEFPALGLRVVCAEAETLENNPQLFTVTPEGTPVLRFRQTGDSIRLPGGSRSLKKLFIDRKIPAANRDRIPVIADESGLIGVYGIGTSLDRQAQAFPAIQIQFENI